MDFLDWLRALFALIATLGLIALAAYGARRLGMMRLGAQATDRRMRVVERLMLDPRRSLVLVRLDGNEHLLLLSPTGDKVVGKQDAPPTPPQVEAGFVSEDAPDSSMRPLSSPEAQS